MQGNFLKPEQRQSLNNLMIDYAIASHIKRNSLIDGEPKVRDSLKIRVDSSGLNLMTRNSKRNSNLEKTEPIKLNRSFKKLAQKDFLLKKVNPLGRDSKISPKKVQLDKLLGWNMFSGYQVKSSKEFFADPLLTHKVTDKI